VQMRRSTRSEAAPRRLRGQELPCRSFAALAHSFPLPASPPRSRRRASAEQPDITANANLTHWMRVGISAGYRLTSGVTRNGFGNADLNGFMLGEQLQFGSF
jgi:hypothetical protein